MANTPTKENKEGADDVLNNPAPETPEKKKGKETVEVEKATLDTILESLKTLEAANKQKDADIEMLKSISDKARLSKWEEKNLGAIIREARVSFWEDNPVVAWTKVKDEVGFKDGRLVVNQVIRLYVDTGKGEPETKELDYLYWAQNVQGQSGQVVNVSKNMQGEFWTIQFKDGRKITTDIRFINAF